MRTRLSKVVLDEVSLVDRGANQFADILIAKRREEVCKCGDTPCEACKAKQKLMKEQEEIEKLGVEFEIATDSHGETVLHKTRFAPVIDISKALDWMATNNCYPATVNKSDRGVEATHVLAEGLSSPRFLVPGVEIVKGLRAKMSMSQITSLIERELRDRFNSPQPGETGSMSKWIWIRDLFRDTVVFDQDGNIFRADYTIDILDPGPKVSFGEKIPVEVIYQDVVNKAELRKAAAVPLAVNKQLDSIRLRALSLSA